MLQMLIRKNSLETFTTSEMLMTKLKKLENKRCLILCLSIMLNQSKEQGRMQKRELHYKNRDLQKMEDKSKPFSSPPLFLPSLLKSDRLQ